MCVLKLVAGLDKVLLQVLALLLLLGLVVGVGLGVDVVDVLVVLDQRRVGRQLVNDPVPQDHVNTETMQASTWTSW